jgi:hypothetical protein
MRTLRLSTVLVFVWCAVAGATVTIHVDKWGTVGTDPIQPDLGWNFVVIWYEGDPISSFDLNLGILTGQAYTYISGFHWYCGPYRDAALDRYSAASAPWDYSVGATALPGHTLASGLDIYNDPIDEGLMHIAYQTTLGGVSTFNLGNIHVLDASGNPVTPILDGATLLPEPTTIALLGLGSLLLIKKNSRRIVD